MNCSFTGGKDSLLSYLNLLDFFCFFILRSMRNAFIMLGNIRTLVLSWNQISSVEGLDRMYSLERLAIDHNNIQYLQDAAGLANLPGLMHLEMKGNPIETHGKHWSSYSILALILHS